MEGRVSDQPRASLTRSQILSGLNLAREKDLKAKTEELEDVKVQLERERDFKQKSERQVQGLQSSLQDAQEKLQRSQEVGEKVRLELKKKTELVEKLERNISHMEDRVRNLEIRASEVEKAELTLESTRRNLESSQHECRAKEGEIYRLQDKYDKTCLELEQANSSIKDLEKKIEDLKHQVRHELMKNENIERGLETIPRLKDDISDRDKTIAQLHKDMDEKTALLAAARKAVRQYKDRIRDLEKEEAAGEGLRRELELCQHEVTSLKQLVNGKDALLFRKTQALEQAKVVIESLPRTQEEKEKMKKIQQLLTQLASIQRDNATPHLNGIHSYDVNGNKGGRVPLTPRGRSNQDGVAGRERELSVDTAPYQQHSQHPPPPRDTDFSLLERCLQENLPAPVHTPPSSSSSPHTQTAVVHPVRRSAPSSASTQYHHHHHHHDAHSRSRQSPRPRNTRGSSRDSLHVRPATSNVYRSETRASSRFPPSLDYPIGGMEGEEEEEGEDGGEGWAHVTNRNHHSNQHGGGGGQQGKVRPYSAVVTGPFRDTEVCSDALSQSSVDTDSEAGGSRDEVTLARLQLSARQKDDVLAAAIAVGDRVTFTVPQKPPRYGRKKPKPLVYTGIVKYVGRLDKEKYDARVYCGVRLDEPMGENDGVYKGKRYMFTPQNHAKFFKIRDVTSILDVKSGQYVPCSRLLVKHLKKSQSFHRNDLIHATM
ncbi:uncharacterized protein LOC143286125 isoform X2 [Babylonia areolata]|uniref:uncharacterized protein LOC143286125 isoform X2 n=1 Tax=Babylonia areolata TaxID=304850 RepID=UPI003FD3C768